MGILIIDGNSVFEIDEECYNRKKVAKECDIDKYMKDKISSVEQHEEDGKHGRVE